MPLDQYDADKEDDKPEVKRTDEMNFWEHLEELRKRIIRAFAAVLVGVVAVFSTGEGVFKYIIYAPLDKKFPTYNFMCRLGEKLSISGLCLDPPKLTLITTTLGEVFFKQMLVSFVGGLLIAAPFVFWQVWLFIKPGLMEAERKAANGFVTICSSLFIIGVLFGYFVIAPFAISFLANYTMGGIGGQSTLDSYIDFLVMMTLPIGLVFELPIIIYFLSKIGIVTPKLLKQYRKHMIIILMLVAGIITPSPDVVSQLLVGVPLYLLYEIGILVSSRVYKKKMAKQNE
jgi:sec-independent protein translocase protein TatC